MTDSWTLKGRAPTPKGWTVADVVGDPEPMRVKGGTSRGGQRGRRGRVVDVRPRPERQPVLEGVEDDWLEIVDGIEGETVTKDHLTTEEIPVEVPVEIGAGDVRGARPTRDMDEIPAPDDEMFMFGPDPLPDWVSELRPHQWDAVREILDAFTRVDVVMLDAPTGSGKTLIAELVRRAMQVRALYVCSDKTLQDQFVHDFPYAKVLKGRANYPTQLEPFPEVTCGDCNREYLGDGEWSCDWCSEPVECSYQIAKREALHGRLGVLNTAYLMHAANLTDWKQAEFTIMDECDVLEREIMSFVEFDITTSMLRSLGLWAPKKGIHRKTIAKWMEEELLPAARDRVKEIPEGTRDVQRMRRRERYARLAEDVARVMGQVEDDGWIRDNDAGPLVLKPIRVDEFGPGVLWRHSKKWLLMSATIVSPEEMADSLGIEAAELSYEVVRVPMTFPVENRRIHAIPAANMVAKEKAEAWPQMATAIGRILDRHPEERVLVHTVSYALAESLAGDLRRGSGRPVLTYRSGAERDAVVAQYRRTEGAVLVAPSLGRGVDFRDEDCRVVIVAKVPFPFLGDKQVSARANEGRRGKLWYGVQTVRTLVQMTGRGVRSEDDWCVTYILDKQFVTNIYAKHKSLFPKWWKEAVRIGSRRDLET